MFLIRKAISTNWMHRVPCFCDFCAMEIQELDALDWHRCTVVLWNVCHHL